MPYLVLDGGGIQHGHIVHGDPLPDDPLAPPLELQLAVAVGEVQEPDSVLGWEIHGVRVQIKEEGPVHCVAEVADVDTALNTILLPVILNKEHIDLQTFTTTTNFSLET